MPTSWWGELLRLRGRELIARPALRLTITERAWDEARYELRRRAADMARHGRVQSGSGAELFAAALALAELHVAPTAADVYAHLETEAHRRIPRDLDDWPTVALALALEAAIWTHDNDFLGCGVATWTTDTLLAHLAS